MSLQGIVCILNGLASLLSSSVAATNMELLSISLPAIHSIALASASIGYSFFFPLHKRPSSEHFGRPLIVKARYISSQQRRMIELPCGVQSLGEQPLCWCFGVMADHGGMLLFMRAFVVGWLLWLWGGRLGRVGKEGSRKRPRALELLDNCWCLLLVCETFSTPPAYTYLVIQWLTQNEEWVESFFSFA